jgi:universal stress protein family protein
MKTQDTLPRPATARIALQRILVPVDFSPLSKKALKYAVKLA